MGREDSCSLSQVPVLAQGDFRRFGQEELASRALQATSA